ncbi:Multidrug resistance protein stp [compost metagenome]
MSNRVDLIGVLTSSLGLVSITYGVIEVGEQGWSDPAALITIFTGVLLLTGFILWERHSSHPLIDPALFRSSSFTWGSILATIVSFAMFGLLFVTPQYFQAALGTDALGAGLRLLPLVGGLLVGSQVTDRLQPKFGARITIAIGFVLLVIGLLIGANTGIDNGYGFASIWITIVGLGIGFVLPAAMDVAMSALSAERSGVGSALIFALRNVGGTMGVAILGTVLSTGYRDKLDLDGLSSPVAEAALRSVSAGAAAARQIHSSELMDSVRLAFIHGMDVMLWVCGGVAALGFVLTLTFLQLKVDSQGRKELESTNMKG